MNKWFATPTYQVAVQALNVIANKMEHPTYAQVEEVLECMRDISKELCVFMVQK